MVVNYFTYDGWNTTQGSSGITLYQAQSEVNYAINDLWMSGTSPSPGGAYTGAGTYSQGSTA
jgi:hypothetical protein